MNHALIYSFRSIALLYFVKRSLHYWRNFYTIAAITSKIDSSGTRKNLDTFQKAFKMPQRVDFCCSGPLAVAAVAVVVVVGGGGDVVAGVVAFDRDSIAGLLCAARRFEHIPFYCPKISRVI